MYLIQPEANSAPSALIIDDNWFNRDIFRIALESAGYRVSEASGGPAGLQILERETFNLLILDLQMPTIDGNTVLRSVRSRAFHKDMHVVVVTAHLHMAAGDIEALSDFVMGKPINIAEFTMFVERLKRARLLTH